MNELDIPRLAFLVVWGGGTIYFFARALRIRYRAWEKHKDVRARRDLMSGLSLFLVALCASLATLFVLFGPAGTGLRGFMTALALGAFLAAGFVMSGEDQVAEEVETQRQKRVHAHRRDDGMSRLVRL